MDTERSKQFRFSLMMLLQFFSRGAWFVTLGTYLGKGLEQSANFVGNSYALFGIGAIISPFFVGMIADRFFPTQKVLGVLNIAAGLMMAVLSQMTDPATFLWILFVYCVVYTPTEALCNSIVFHHLSRRYFPYVRLFGTIGWVLAGISVNHVIGRFVPDVELTSAPLLMSAGVSILLGIYNFTLPRTEVVNKGEKVGFRDIIGVDALKMLKDRYFVIFLGACLLIGIPIQMYFAFFNMFLNDIGVENVVSKMSLGQVSEAAFMVFIPWMAMRYGLKRMMALGLVLWSLRFFLFSQITVDAEFLIIISILIHGACYDFFNVTGSIYVDVKGGEAYRGAAQGLFMLVFLGLGKFFGAKVAGFISSMYEGGVNGTMFDWAGIFQVTGVITFIVTVLFVLLFHDKQTYELDNQAG